MQKQHVRHAVLLPNSESPKFSAAKCKPVAVLQECLRNASINKKVSSQISVAQINSERRG